MSRLRETFEAEAEMSPAKHFLAKQKNVTCITVHQCMLTEVEIFFQEESTINMAGSRGGPVGPRPTLSLAQALLSFDFLLSVLIYYP